MLSLRNLFDALKVAWRWNRAADKGAKGEYGSALQEILAAEKVGGRSLPPEFLLLKAVLAREVGDPVLAIRCTVEAHRQIGSWRRYADAERRYLECYASDLGLKLMQEQEYSGRHNFSVDYTSVDLDKVPGATKRVFPLRDHPAWRK